MVKRGRGRSGQYSDAFKTRLVAESREEGSSVPQVSRRHGVSTNRIYTWRQDERFRGNPVAEVGFVPVTVEAEAASVVTPASGPIGSSSSPRIEITLENGRRLSVCDGVDPGFVLALARGLAA